MDFTRHKRLLRRQLRKARREHAASLLPEVSALVFRRPPTGVLDLIPPDAVIGFYYATSGEAPAAAYVRHFFEQGHSVALPRVESREAPMTFHLHTDPFDQSDLEPGPMSLLQPAPDAPPAVPQVLFLPLLGFTARGERLGQGGGHYDRWLAAHPETISIGLAWDVQEVEELPMEPHDVPLTAIVTPTRLLGPF